MHNDNYKKQDDILKGAFELFGKDIAVIHAKDFKVEDKIIKSLPTGNGDLNSELLLSLIKKYKPFIHVLLEDTNPTNVMASKEYLEKIYKGIS